MELLQLKYFETAARLENFSRAAEAFSIPQSSISKAVARLETELSCRLFDRTGKRVALNDAGKDFLIKVQTALGSLNDGRKMLETRGQVQRDNIRLAVWEGSKLLPRMLSDFRRVNGGASFSLIQHTGAEGPVDSFDLCISALPLPDDRLDYALLLREEILLAVPASHPMADRDAVSLNEVRQDSFIGLASCKSLRRVTDAWCAVYGFTPHIVFESDDAATVRGLIENGLGVAFIPQKTWKTDGADTIRYLHIADLDCRRTLVISWDRGRSLMPAARDFRQFAVEWYGTLA